MLNQTGEFLTFDSNPELRLKPMLAVSWTHIGDGSVWTFKLRPNVKFHIGQAVHRGRRRVRVPVALGSEELLQRAVGVHRRAEPERDRQRG